MPTFEPPANRQNGAATGSRFFETALSSIPDFVYAFDTDGRFAYANAAMLGLFGLRSETMLGRSFADLGYPKELADRLNGHIQHVVATGEAVEDEVFFRSPTGYAAHFSFIWGPVRRNDGAVELVVGVSRDTSHRHRMEEQLRRSEARLRAATELVGVGIYSWDPRTGALEWDDRLRAMWGLNAAIEVDMEVFQSGIHPDDLPRVQQAIAACTDPAGTGLYSTEYRVIGHDDGVTRHVATKGRTTFADGKAIGFIGAAIDVTTQRRTEFAIRASEAQFRSFAEHSSNLIWIGDPQQDAIIYRSAAYERIWGQPREQAADDLALWLQDVHEDDREQVTQALSAVKGGEVVKFDYRLVRPSDGAIRRLHDTSFPILDDAGEVMRIGGITEDLTPEDNTQLYLVCARNSEARQLSKTLRALGYKVRSFTNAAAFLDVASILVAGCVLVDLRTKKGEGLKIPRELKARAIDLPTILLDGPGAELEMAVSAMKAGAADYLIMTDGLEFQTAIASAISECAAAARPTTSDESASGRVARLTSRERDVLLGLVEGGTNKSIAQKLGISPRTVELHRAQLMHRLDASTLTELLQIALAAGLAPANPGWKA